MTDRLHVRHTHRCLRTLERSQECCCTATLNAEATVRDTLAERTHDISCSTHRGGTCQDRPEIGKTLMFSPTATRSNNGRRSHVVDPPELQRASQRSKIVPVTPSHEIGFFRLQGQPATRVRCRCHRDGPDRATMRQSLVEDDPGVWVGSREENGLCDLIKSLLALFTVCRIAASISQRGRYRGTSTKGTMVHARDRRRQFRRIAVHRSSASADAPSHTFLPRDCAAMANVLDPRVTSYSSRSQRALAGW